MADASEPFGPFREGCDPVERVAQLRTLRTLVHVHGYSFEESVHAETDLLVAESRPEWNLWALASFERLPPLVKRRILTTFAYIHKPLYSSARQQSRKGTAHAHLD